MLNELNLDPDFDIDAFMQCDGSPDLLCNVKVWLPVHAAADARVQVEVPISERSSGLDPLGLVKLVNVDQQGKCARGTTRRSWLLYPQRHCGCAQKCDHSKWNDDLSSTRATLSL